MHLVGLTIEIYYDARPYERQISQITTPELSYVRFITSYYMFRSLIRPSPCKKKCKFKKKKNCTEGVILYPNRLFIHNTFFAAFAKLRKATIIFFMSVDSSVRPHGTKWLRKRHTNIKNYVYLSQYVAQFFLE